MQKKLICQMPTNKCITPYCLKENCSRSCCDDTSEFEVVEIYQEEIINITQAIKASNFKY